MAIYSDFQVDCLNVDKLRHICQAEAIKQSSPQSSEGKSSEYKLRMVEKTEVDKPPFSTALPVLAGSMFVFQMLSRIMKVHMRTSYAANSTMHPWDIKRTEVSFILLKHS